MGIKESLEGLGKKLGQQPWYVWAGVMGGGGLIGWYILKQRAAAAAAANTQQGYVTPGADQSALDAALNGVQLGNMAGIPYGYQNSDGPVDNYPTSGSTGSTGSTSGSTGSTGSTSGSTGSTGSTSGSTGSTGSSSTSTTTQQNGGNNSSTSVNTNSNGGQQDPNPYAGLLGPNVAVNFPNRTFTSPTVKNATPLPIPSGDQLVQGGQNRVWYIDKNIQHLLTDGNGPPVTNSGFPVNSPQNTPAGTGGGHFHEPVNAVRSTVWDLTTAGIGHQDLGWEL